MERITIMNSIFGLLNPSLLLVGLGGAIGSMMHCFTNVLLGLATVYLGYWLFRTA